MSYNDVPSTPSSSTGNAAGSGAGPALPPPAPLAPHEERTWAMLAHLSSLLSLISGGLFGPIAALLIWLVYRERSAYVGRQALQSFAFQVGMVVVTWVTWTVTVALMAVVIGFCLLPVALLVTAAAVVWPLVGAYECSQGRDFRYPLLSDMLGSTQP